MSLNIIKGGLLDTVQDTGRYGKQDLAINPGGAMDVFSACLANALLGKDLSSPVIELHFPCSKFLILKDTILCLAGADFSAKLEGSALPLLQPVAVRAAAILEFNAITKGARCYISLFQHLHIPKWLNSYSTHSKAGVGGFKGRKLETGDEIEYDNSLPITHFLQNQKIHFLPWKATNFYQHTKQIRFITGHEWDWLTMKGQTSFLNQHFTISTLSDRMGFRLKGQPLEIAETKQHLSSGVTFGTVQLLPGGDLIILMADHQTTGGYPRIAHVISADLHHLAQLQPNEAFNFIITHHEAAERLLLEQENYLHQLQKTCNFKIQTLLHAVV